MSCLTLKEARQFYSPDELTDDELQELVQEVDCLQMAALDNNLTFNEEKYD